jgi:hypothetical protein
MSRVNSSLAVDIVLPHASIFAQSRTRARMTHNVLLSGAPRWALMMPLRLRRVRSN